MNSPFLAALRRRTSGHRAQVRTHSAVDQRMMDVALMVSRQSIRPAPVRHG